MGGGPLVAAMMEDASLILASGPAERSENLSVSFSVQAWNTRHVKC